MILSYCAWRHTYKASPVLHSARSLTSPPTSIDENVDQGFFIGYSMQNMSEIWIPIEGYLERYAVNQFGEVWSCKANKVLTPNKMTHGYLCVHLYRGGRSTRRVRTIHQLVAEAFLGNPHKYSEVNHKDFNKANNNVKNLEWVSRKENVQHAIRGGRKANNKRKVKGISLSSGLIYTFDSLMAAEIAMRGVQTGGISHALRNNRPAYGCVWWLA
jgi:hypothetical protein